MRFFPKTGGHYIHNITSPRNALLKETSLNITIDVQCLMPPKMGNLMTPEKTRFEKIQTTSPEMPVTR